MSAYLEVSAAWLAFAHRALPVISAFTCSPFSAKLPQQQQWLRHLGLCLLLGIRGRINHHTLQQGIAAILCYYSLHNNAARQSDYTVVVTQLRRLAKHYWASKIIPPKRLTSSSLDCFDTAWVWIRLIQKNPTSAFADSLGKLCIQLPKTAQQQLALLAEYPGLYHEGSRGVVKQQTAIVLGQLDDALLIYEINNHRVVRCLRSEFIPSAHSPIAFSQWMNLVETLSGREQDGDVFEIPDHKWTIPESYPISRPPPSLQKLLKALNNKNIAINKVVDLVSTEPTFSGFLTQAASRDNRMQLPVDDVKHSILTFGLERVGNMLVQYALFRRLTQHDFPLLRWFSNFSQIATILSGELAAYTGKITPQSAGLVTTIMVSPLFTLPELKSELTVPQKSQRLFDVSTIAAIRVEHKAKTIKQRLLSLAKSWEQNETQSKLIACHGRMPSEVPSSLKLAYVVSITSIIWARQWLFSHEACSDTQRFLREVHQLDPHFAAQKNRLRPFIAHLLVCPLP